MTQSQRWSALKSATTAAALGLSACLPVSAQDIPSPEARAELTTRSGQTYLVLTLPELWVSPNEKYSNAVVELPAVSPITGQVVELQLGDPSVKPFFELSDDKTTLRLPKVRYEGTLLHNVRLKGAAHFPNVPTSELPFSGSSKNVAIDLLLAGSSVSLVTAQGWPAAPVDAVTFCSARWAWVILDDLARMYGAVAGSVRYDKCNYSNGLGLIDISVELPGGNRVPVPYISFRWLN